MHMEYQAMIQQDILEKLLMVLAGHKLPEVLLVILTGVVQDQLQVHLELVE